MAALSFTPESSKAQRLGVGHSVFLSHSGEDKVFVQILARDLRMCGYVPFFDQESLQKGDKVDMNDILEIAKTCKLGLIVLSDDFFSKTQNPMLELSTFVEHKVPLLPLFYKLTVPDIKDKIKREYWKEKWSQWSTQDSRINIPKWVTAVKALTDTTGLEYHLEATNILQYARVVAEKVCGILYSDICPPDDKVQGKDRLCQEVKHMFADAPDFRGAKVLALSGMEGVGKSTLCTALRKFYHGEFAGRVCYVEFTRQQTSGRNQNGLQLKDVQTVSRLTNVDYTFVKTYITDVDKGIAHLDKHLGRSEKFLLILDNIHEYSLDEARKLVLDRESFPCGSHLLFLGRSCNPLARLLGPIDNGHMICRFPDLRFEEIERIFLNETLFFLQNESVIQQRQRDYDAHSHMKEIVKECIELCTVSSGCGRYNPLMLKSLASFLRSKAADPIKWKASLSKLKKDRSEVMQNMFELLQQSFDVLQQQERDLFLDLALYTMAGKDVKKLHFEQEEADVDDCLLNLTDVSFLSKDYVVLGVHRDFARKLARQSVDLLYVQDSRLDSGSLHSRLRSKQRHLKKLAFVNCTFSLKDACLNLSGSKCIGVLLLDNVQGLMSINLGQNDLCRMEVKSPCALQVEEIRAISLTLCTQFDGMSRYNRIPLPNPSHLMILELGGINSTSWMVDAAHLGRCNSLKFVQLDNIKLTNSNLELSCWPCLEELKLSNLAGVTMLSGLENLKALRKFALALCNQLSELQLPGSLRHCSLEKCDGLIKIDVVGLGMIPVESFDEEECTAENKFAVCDCEKLEELSGLCELKNIHSFAVRGLSRLHKVKDVLDFSLGTSDCGGIPCFISYLELTGLGNIGGLCKLSVEQVSMRGFVKKLVEEWLKDARGLERLEVNCAESGLCGCDAYLPNFGLLPHLQSRYKHNCKRARIDSRSTPENQLPQPFSELDVSLCVASFLELKNENPTSNTTGDLCVTQREVVEVPAN